MDAIRQIHFTSSLLLLMLYAGMCAAVDAGARSPRLAKWLDDREQSSYARHDRAFIRTRNYGNFFETLMLDEVRHADYSTGGAYVFGSSNIVFCAEFADLPPSLRRLIHNYGFPGAAPSEIRHFMKYLVDREGFLSAGGDKNAVLLCLNHTDLLGSTAQLKGAGGFFPSYLNGSGLFSYDAVQGIKDAPMSDWQRTLKLRRTQWRSFIRRLERATESSVHRQADPIALRKIAEQTSAAGELMDGSEQWIELESLLDDLKARKIRATVLLMPTGSWFKGLPAYEQFMARMPKVTAVRNIPMIDCAGLLKDDEFMDHHHATFAGAHKVHEVLLRWAYDQLHQTGALPTTAEGNNP